MLRLINIIFFFDFRFGDKINERISFLDLSGFFLNISIAFSFGVVIQLEKKNPENCFRLTQISIVSNGSLFSRSTTSSKWIETTFFSVYVPVPIRWITSLSLSISLEEKKKFVKWISKLKITMKKEVKERKGANIIYTHTWVQKKKSNEWKVNFHSIN